MEIVIIILGKQKTMKLKKSLKNKKMSVSNKTNSFFAEIRGSY